MTCGKPTYSRRQAEENKRARLRSRNAPADYLRIYFCALCRGYHLTHFKPYK